MKRVAIFTVIAMLCGGLISPLEVFAPVILPVYAAPASVPLRERMPDISRSVLVGELERECAFAVSYTVKFYNTRGDGVKGIPAADTALYFLKPEKKPFMAVYWRAPDYDTVDRLLMDLDLNGYADIVGVVFDDVFGGHPCDALMHYLANKKP